MYVYIYIETEGCMCMPPTFNYRHPASIIHRHVSKHCHNRANVTNTYPFPSPAMHAGSPADPRKTPKSKTQIVPRLHQTRRYQRHSLQTPTVAQAFPGRDPKYPRGRPMHICQKCC